MKKLIYTLLAFMFVFQFEAKAQPDSLALFLHKFGRFLESPSAKMRWTASPDSPASIRYTMPNAQDVRKTYVPDPETGLRHYPHIAQVYDPQTGYFIAYDAHRYFLYQVNTRAHKIYKGKTEVEIKKQQPEQDRQ